MGSRNFSLTEKLAVTGAFLALVAMVVGTEDDPGLVIAGQEAISDLRPAPPRPALPAPVASPRLASNPTASVPPSPSAPVNPTVDAPPLPETAPRGGGEDDDSQFSPELGRVPLDFSKGPPSG